MRKFLLALVPVLCLTLALGCQEQTKEQLDAEAKKKKADADAEAARKKGDPDAEAQAKKKKADAEKEYNAATIRAEYNKEMERKIDKINEDIDRYEKKAAAAEGDKKARMDKKVAELKGKRDSFQASLKKDEKAETREAWEKLKTGFGRAYDELAEAVKGAADEFK